MDEPLSALDARTGSRLLRHPPKIRRNVNLTVVFITRDPTRRPTTTPNRW